MLASLGTAAVTGLAGCAGGLLGGDGDTYLSGRDWKADPDVLPFPTHGDHLPSATLPAALRGETVTIPDDFAGRDVLLTFVYTHCRTMCPRLTGVLAGVQKHALANDYVDRMAFVEASFDPERDTAERFRAWADQHGVTLDGGNWYFLRPESVDRAKAVVQDTYGVTFEKTHPKGMDGYMFVHGGYVVLANKGGYVEKTYQLKQQSDDPVTWQTVRDDLQTLREREG